MAIQNINPLINNKLNLTEYRSGFFMALLLEAFFEPENISPDNSENPFVFFFKKQKIAADSGKLLLQKIIYLLKPKHYEENYYFIIVVHFDGFVRCQANGKFGIFGRI